MKALAKSGTSWAAVLLLFSCPWAPNASIILPPWEEEALGADFIGVVECEVAGDVVAKCKVIESWKGPEAGTKFSFSPPADEYGNRYPIPLCGQRFLVMASRVTRDKGGFGWTPAPYETPLSWRDLPSDFAMSHRCQPLPLLPPTEGEPYEPLGAFGVKHRDLPSFKREVLSLLHAPAGRQEARAMQVHFDDCVNRWYYDHETKRLRLRGALAALCQKVRLARSADEIVSLLLYHRPATSREWLDVVQSTIASGGPSIFRRVPSIPPEDFPGGPAAQRDVMYGLERRNSTVKLRAAPRISPAQEARSLRKLTERFVRDPSEPRQLPRSTQERLDQMRKDVQRLETPEQIVERLVQAARGSEEITQIVYFILIGGAQRTLRLAESSLPEAFPAPPYDGTWVADDIRRRLGLSRSQEREDQPNARLRRREHPTEAELAQYRKQLADTRPELRADQASDDEARRRAQQRVVDRFQEVEQALDVLTIHDPAVAAAFLLREAEMPEPRPGCLVAYRLASWFGWKCGSNREQHFRDLLKARNPVVRVAAAVYLCFENEEAGLAALREMRQLAGPPGAWAAATLARRGDKTAVRQALECCSGKVFADIRLRMGYNLLDHVLVLLSNSAKASKVPQPAEPYLQWWERYQDEITLHDVWMPLLEKQKID